MTENIYDSTAFMCQGGWHKSGAVHFLTKFPISDIGGQAAGYDSFCAMKHLIELFNSVPGLGSEEKSNIAPDHEFSVLNP